VHRKPGVDPVMIRRLNHLADGHLQDSDRGLWLLFAAAGQKPDERRLGQMVGQPNA
jgi:hypothetical protein